MTTEIEVEPARMAVLVERLFDAITTTNCRTRHDVVVAGGFSDLWEVDQALAFIRIPDNAEEYGWTVPHVRRGPPREGQEYRFQAVGLQGDVLDAEAIKLVREGALSTVRAIATNSRNEAYALRLAGPMVDDRHFRTWARDTAVILEGISTQASIEATRLAKVLNGKP